MRHAMVGAWTSGFCTAAFLRAYQAEDWWDVFVWGVLAAAFLIAAIVDRRRA